jgi:hypothetical protein
MRVAIFIACFTLSLMCNSQVHIDTVMCNLINSYRCRHGLQALKWDNNIYREACDTYSFEDSLGGNDSLIDIDNTGELEIGAFAGMYGEYLSGSYLFDGDSSAIHDIDSMYFQDIIDNPGERALLLMSKTGKMACLIAIRERYMNNPDKNSVVRQFQLWYIAMMVGVSY